ncbi:MAG: T9SS type A sorting domain-containing protein [Flavobacteriales bacterium]|jgi:parallel beta-helix repeat protein|nr:T9SS type A sorting domain-containing protein [Flavobacteriales bacterium]
MMKNLLVIIFAIAPFYSWSINYYCDPVNGSMTNPGTQAAPWGSLEAVFNQGTTFNGGDKIILLSGNHGFPKITGVNSSNVEIISHTGHSPIIERIRIGNTAHAAFWLLNGLIIQSENTSQYPINLIDLYSNTNNITVINCTITSNLTTNNWTRNDWRTKANNGVFSRGTGHKFNYNTIKNIAIGLTMSSSNSQFIGNTVQYFTIDGVRGLGDDCAYIGNSILDNVSVYYYSENHYDGFQSYSCCPVGNAIVNNVVIKQNTIINCTDTTRQFRGSMQGIGCFDGMYNNWTIENNVVIVDNWHGITLTGATNCRIVNNTVIDPYDVSYQDPNDPQQFGNVGPAWIKITAHKTDGGIYSGTPSTNNTIMNNLVPTMANDQNIGTVTNNILLGASANYSNFFVNHNAADLQLIATASAIDAGISTGAPAVDIEGTSRPQGNGVDVGAYEYSGCNLSFDIFSSQDTICKGDLVTLTTDALTAASWNNGVVDNVAFSPLSTQTYTATVNDGNCSHSEQVTIVVNPIPVITIIQNGNQLETTTTNGTIQWNLDGNSIVGANDSIYEYTINGNYTVTFVDQNGCEGTSNTITIQGVGFEKSNDNAIQLYPNPTNAIVNIESAERIERIQLFNVSGTLVAEYHQLQPKTVQLPKQNAGVYYLFITTEKGVTSQKIIFTK